MPSTIFARRAAARALVCVHSMLACASTDLQAQASHPPDLFAAPIVATDSTESRRSLAGEADKAGHYPNRTLRRSRPVQFDAGVLADLASGAIRRLRVPLFDDVSVTAVVEHIKPSPPDGASLSARLDGIVHGHLFLVTDGNVTVAAVHAGRLGTFDISPGTDGVLRIRQVDLAAEPSDYCGVLEPPPVVRGAGCPLAGSPLAGFSADDGGTIDVLAVYTAAAATAAGGDAALRAKIDLAASVANQAYANSTLPIQVRIVGKLLVDYTESGIYQTDLPRLTERADGFMDSVHADRDTYGADIVSLWVSSLNAGGAGFSLFALGSNDDGRFGFQVMRQDVASTETFAHELGHNFGCQHDRVTTFPGGFFNYSYGYREPGSAWKTIMAYPPGANILYFSNPNLVYNGPLGNPGPMGVPGNDLNTSCDNTLTHRNTSFTLANFRPSTLGSAPPPRLYVRANAPAGGDGASWATAFNNLQDAMGIAVRARGAVDEIWVTAGTYKPDNGSGDRLRTFRLVSGVSIYGGFAGTETALSQRNPALNETVLSGEIGVVGDVADNSWHVVRAEEVDATAVLDGFTIRDGNANSAFPRDAGGGIRVSCGSPTIRNCRFTVNAAAFGGAAHHDNSSAPRYTDCTFSNNTAVFSGGATNDTGGASAHYERCTFTLSNAVNHGAANIDGGASVTLIDCTFNANAADWGGALGVYNAAANLLDCDFSLNGCIYGGGGIVCGGGGSITINNCQFDLNFADFGGGFYTHSGASASLTDCSFTQNQAFQGGAIHTFAASPTIFRCNFTANTVGDNGTGAGGAISTVSGSAAQISYCTFDQNAAGCCGGAVFADQSNPTILRSTFVANVANFGGGCWYQATAAPIARDSIFLRNRAGLYGGAVHCSAAAAVEFANCVFSGNLASTVGGVAWNVGGSQPRWTNCTIVGNTSGWVTGGISDDTSGSIIANSILWQNSDSFGSGETAQIERTNATTTVRYSIVQGWTGALGGPGNSGANPLLLDADGLDNTFGTLDDNPRLSLGSFAIDSADNAAVPAGLIADYDVNARFYDHPATPNSGAGTPPIVDRGAFEFAAACPGDLNFDRNVNESDLGILLSAWKESAAGDLDRDGHTRESDLGILLSAWQTNCP